MLDGFWRLELADDRGMAARGAVALCSGRISGIGDLAGLTGEYQCQGNLVLGMLDLVLHATDVTGGEIAERVQLHIQGGIAAATLAASGTDLAEPGRRIALSLQYRSAWVPQAQPAARAGVPVAATRSDVAAGLGAAHHIAWQADRRTRATAAHASALSGKREHDLVWGKER